MKKYTFLPLFILFFTINQSPLNAAILKHKKAEPAQYRPASQQGHQSLVLKNKKTKTGWFSKFKSKLEKKIKKWQEKPSREKAKLHLYICAGLVLLSIISFALSGYGQVFSVLGSVFAIGGAVFFILWLLNFTGTI